MEKKSMSDNELKPDRKKLNPVPTFDLDIPETNSRLINCSVYDTDTVLRTEDENGARGA